MTDPLQSALAHGDNMIADLLRCEGRGCEAEEVRQIVAGIREDISVESLEATENAA